MITGNGKVCYSDVSIIQNFAALIFIVYLFCILGRCVQSRLDRPEPVCQARQDFRL